MQENGDPTHTYIRSSSIVLGSLFSPYKVISSDNALTATA